MKSKDIICEMQEQRDAFERSFQHQIQELVWERGQNNKEQKLYIWLQ